VLKGQKFEPNLALWRFWQDYESSQTAHVEPSRHRSQGQPQVNISRDLRERDVFLTELRRLISQGQGHTPQHMTAQMQCISRSRKI